jgi:hypothetical protein
MTPIPPELVARCVALVRRMGVDDPYSASNNDYEVARAITKLLPAPIDPDLIEARKLVSVFCIMSADSYIDGSQDDTPFIRIATKAIKRGRSLAHTQEAGQSPRSEEGAR